MDAPVDTTLEAPPIAVGDAGVRRVRPGRRPTGHAAPRPWSSSLPAVLVVLLGQLLVALDVTAAVLRPVASLLVLVGVPVLVIARRGSWGDDGVRRTLYASGLTLLGLMLVGLALNTALPPLGVDRPLARIPVVLASTAVDLGLLAWRPDVALLPGARAALVRVGRARLDPALAVGVLSVLLAVGGAVRLNNGAGGTVAVLGHVLAGAALALLLVTRTSWPLRDAVTVYLAAASLLLSTSLRGWYITGHDIQREYIVYLLTQRPDRWDLGALGSAYNACLSLNILPTVLANHTGLSGVLVFKVLMQLLFALVPVATYTWAQRLVSRRMAVLATLLLVSFPTFFNDMPYMTRQETAFFFVVVALLASQEHRWSNLRRRALVVVLGAGVIVSHYSTTYMLLMAITAGAVGAQVGPWVARRWAARRARRTGQPAAGAEPASSSMTNTTPGRGHALGLLHPVVVALLLALTWVWTVPATHSGGHLADTVASTASELINGGGGPGSSDLSYGLFSGAQATPEERFSLFVDQTMKDRAEQGPDGWLIQQFTQDEPHPEIVEPTDLPLTPVGDVLNATPLKADTANSLLRLFSASLLQVFLVVGLLVLLLRRLPVRRFGLEARWLCYGTVTALAAQVLIPGLSVDYGVLRAFQQALLVVAPLMAIGLVTSLVWLRRWAAPAAAVLALVFFASLTGVVSRITGGFPGQLAIANSGEYYDLYYVAPSEVQAIGWLSATTPDASLQSEVVSDKVTTARMQASLGDHAIVSDEFFPTQLRTGSYVYLGAQNVEKHQATVFYTGNLITYRYPVDLLDRKLDLLYSNPTSEIYR